MLYGMPYGKPPGLGPKSGCRNVLAESMLRIQAALCAFTGILEMSVFQMLLAGNIGQFGAPGTVVPPSAPGLAALGAWTADRPRPALAPRSVSSPAARTTLPDRALAPDRRSWPAPAAGT